MEVSPPPKNMTAGTSPGLSIVNLFFLLVQAVCVYHPWWPSQTWLTLLLLHALLFTHFKGSQEADFGPGGLHATPVVAFASVAGHC